MIGFEKDPAANGQASGADDNQILPRVICLDLPVHDPEVIRELIKHAEGPSRQEYALSALRLGVLALRQANGVVDSQAIREEGARLVAAIGELLAGHSRETVGSIAAALTQYFDPAKGDLPQRLERLVKKDGDLEAVLCRHLDGEASTLARTLIKHIGEQSPLLRLLSPNQSDGILAALKDSVEAALKVQREHILGQFSLDDKDSALSRLLSEVTDTNGQLKKAFTEDLNTIRSEFSLDNEQGALSRLVGRVERAQSTIVEQFSQDNEDSALSRLSRLLEKTNSKVESSLTLDDEKSPLSRLRRELCKIIEDLAKSHTEFQAEVRETLVEFRARREEAARSTAHGGDFQDAVGAALQPEVQRLGDVFEATGNKTGCKQYCKTGDFVIALGQESAAPAARIVCEAKEDKSYDLTAALDELRAARENRAAQVGIFVFSKATAPAGMEPLARFGSDIVIVWDRDDVTTDMLLKAALSIARALVVREQLAKEKCEADFAEMDTSLTRIAKEAENLGQITTWASTIQNNGKKILDKVGKIQENLEKHIDLLREHLERLKEDAVPVEQ